MKPTLLLVLICVLEVVYSHKNMKILRRRNNILNRQRANNHIFVSVGNFINGPAQPLGMNCERPNFNSCHSKLLSARTFWDDENSDDEEDDNDNDDEYEDPEESEEDYDEDTNNSEEQYNNGNSVNTITVSIGDKNTFTRQVYTNKNGVRIDRMCVKNNNKKNNCKESVSSDEAPVLKNILNILKRATKNKCIHRLGTKYINCVNRRRG